jgi:hypothetical protein
MVPTVIAYPTRVTDEESKEAYKFLFDASESN